MIRIIVIFLDGLGIGGLPDVQADNDAGANTLGKLDLAARKYLKDTIDERL